MAIRIFTEGPYYDDYDASKGFHRILFKPGVAVQARELTQLQTMLQTQIERHGSHIFQDGSIVLGGQTSYDFTVQYLRIELENLGNAVNPSLLVDRVLIGGTSGATAKVITYETEDTYINLIVKTFSDVPFSQGETLLYQPDPDVAGTQMAVLVDENFVYKGNASIFSIDEGVFFTRGLFVFVEKQTVVLAYDRYNLLGTVVYDGTAPSVRCGLDIVETIVDSDEDTTLLDPALGSYNFNAPGADRYKVYLDLVAKPLLKQAVVVPTVDESTTAITSIQIVDGGNGYPTSDFLDVGVVFTGSSLDEDGNGAEGQVTSVDPDTGTITSIALPNGGSGFKQYSATVTVAEPSDDATDFIELSRFDDGELIKALRYPLYSNIGDTMARRTYDESGDYTVNPFVVRLSDFTGQPAKFIINIDPGKAYVRGYEIEMVSTARIPNDRARGTSHERDVEGYDINSYYGNYMVVDRIDITGIFDPTDLPEVDLVNGSTVIGTATLVYISSVDADTLRFHLANVVMDPNEAGARIENVTKIVDGANEALVDADARVLEDSSSARLFFDLPQRNVKTVDDSLDFSYRTMKTGTIASNEVTITQTGGLQFKEVSSSASDKASAYLIFNTTDGVAVDITGITVSTTFNGSTATATFSGGALTSMNGDSVSIYAILQGDNIGRKNKTLQTSTAEAHSTVSGQTEIILDFWDGVELTSVMSGANDVTNRFYFDSGMRDASYEYAKLILKPGESMPVGGVDVTYDYYEHSALGSYFSVDSYPDYDTIPVYVAKDGSEHPLQNVLDFRYTPGADDPLVPDIFDDIEVDFTYYVGRIDRLVLTSRGEFKVIQGVPSLTPVKPLGDNMSMTVALMSIAPYTRNVKTDVKLTLIDNRRYTMRDIGILDSRIGRLEYYNTLSQLEKQVSDLLVLDADGNDRFKNGMLVDNFLGHSVSDVSNPDFYAGISYPESFMTCPTDLGTWLTRPINSTREDVAISNRVVTLAYDKVPFIVQNKASKAISVNPFNVTAFEGKTVMDPPSDFWQDVERLPDIVVNEIGENDNWEAVARANGINPRTANQVVWGAWTDNWTGRQYSDEFIADHDQDNGLGMAFNRDGSQAHATRVGTKTSIAFETVTKSTGERIVNTSVIPFMRTISIYFASTGMKPNTRVYPLFDDSEIQTETVRSEVLKVIPVTGGLAVPNIKAFEYPAGMARVTQDQGGGTIVSGNVIMSRNGNIHVVREGNDPFLASVDPAKTLEFRYNILTADGTLTEYNTEFEITDVSEKSDGSASSFKTDAQGNISGVYTVPENTFYTGDRVFRLIDDLSNDLADATTYADYMFASFGLKITKQETFVSTRVPVIKRETVRQEVAIWIDPLAETFLVDAKVYPQGIFLESVDLFFKNKDENLPVRIEIRPTVNGYPSSTTVVPFSSVEKDPDEVNITNIDDGELVPTLSDPRTVTNFKFPFPLYLLPNKEYALIVLSNSNLYEAYVAEMGAIQIGGEITNQKITEQPYTGSLFKSQNASTWTASQEEDLMFRLNRCDFVANGQVEIAPDGFADTSYVYDILNVSSNNIEFNGITTLDTSFKTTSAAGVTDSDWSPFILNQDVYFNSRRQIHDNRQDVAAVTSQTTYDVPELDEDIDTIDILWNGDPVSKAWYKIRPKEGGAEGEMELVWVSAVADIPETGDTITFLFNSGTKYLLELATSNPHVSPLIDLADLAPKYIQNQINEGGVSASAFSFPSFDDLPTPKITLGSTGGGTGAEIRLQVNQGRIYAVIIDDGGSGYSGSTTATVTSGQSPAPTVVATIDLTVDSGVITAAEITDAGEGYLSPSMAVNSTEGSSASVYPIVEQIDYTAEDTGVIVGYVVVTEGSGYIDDFTATITHPDTSAQETVEAINETSARGGNCVSRYICRRVELANGFDAEDLKVYLSAMRPQAGHIAVYYKVLSASDGTDWSDRDWVLMQSTGEVTAGDLQDYKEMEFGTTDGNCHYGEFVNFKMFAIKVVLTSDTLSEVPRIKDFRVVALDTAYDPA